MRKQLPFLALLSTLAIAAAIGIQVNSAKAGDDAAAPAVGHCDFKLKNQWVGPLKSCSMPATAAQCGELGKKDENSDAVWTAGSCPSASLVGVCKRADASIYYYEGDASGLEVGCGFQSGTWSAAAK